LNVPFVDLEAQYREVEEQLRPRLFEVVERGRYILGPEVAEFEEAMARLHGVSCGIGVASGTDALLLSLLAAGVGPGDEVITTPFTFVATAESILHAGARPVFADIEEETFNIDPGQVEGLVTEKTKAILPVHLFGLPADMAALSSLAGRRGLKVIEDCAQSAGARVGERLAGGLGDASAFSFFPTKNLGGLGDGGLVLTDDPGLADRVRLIRGHGSAVRDRYEMLGYNSRLDTLQAAALLVKLPRLEEWNERRRRIATLYGELLAGIGMIRLPRESRGATHVYNQYTITAERRDELKAHLDRKGIGSMIYYSEPLHTQPVFAGLGYRSGDFPVTEKACRRVLSLPVHPNLSEGQVRAVAGAVREFFFS